MPVTITRFVEQCNWIAYNDRLWIAKIEQVLDTTLTMTRFGDIISYIFYDKTVKKKSPKQVVKKILFYKMHFFFWLYDIIFKLQLCT